MDYVKIKQIIDAWDPIGLLSMDGCPKDEYDPEIKELIEKLNRTMSVVEISGAIYDVFYKMFGSDVFTEDISTCKEIARQIKNF